jgi:peptidoglycan hydrolase-like protein with peptidoglycan-binding domain
LHLVIRKFVVLGALLTFCAGHALAATHKTSGKASGGKASKHHHGKRKASWKKHGQQGIQPERAAEIQKALIRANYLTGEPNGVWDTRTQAALVKFQADNGWQTKVVPDSRALIKLGLGPNYSAATLLNPPSPGAPAGGATSTTASRSINGPSEK